jgi:hypothetical protein
MTATLPRSGNFSVVRLSVEYLPDTVLFCVREFNLYEINKISPDQKSIGSPF